MKSASQLSKEIRAKKKAMQDKHDVVDLSGIPMDATDEEIMHQESLTSDLGLDTNEPKQAHPTNTSPNAHTLVEDRAADAEASIPDEAKRKRMARASRILSR